MSETKIWNKKNLNEMNSFRHFPSEMILRAVFSEQYFINKIESSTRSKVLDVGCLFVNNLVPFSDRGYALYGTEVTIEGVEIAKECSIINNIQTNVYLGFNSDLPFESNFFNITMSIATIHYEENLDGIRNSFKEFARVLKHNGTLILKTVAPKHEMFIKSNRIKGNIYKLEMESDLRHNQKFFFFENEKELIEIAGEYFEKVEFARITESYPKLALDFYLLKCLNPKK